MYTLFSSSSRDSFRTGRDRTGRAEQHRTEQQYQEKKRNAREGARARAAWLWQGIRTRGGKESKVYVGRLRERSPPSSLQFAFVRYRLEYPEIGEVCRKVDLLHTADTTTERPIK